MGGHEGLCRACLIQNECLTEVLGVLASRLHPYLSALAQRRECLTHYQCARVPISTLIRTPLPVLYCPSLSTCPALFSTRLCRWACAMALPLAPATNWPHASPPSTQSCSQQVGTGRRIEMCSLGRDLHATSAFQLANWQPFQTKWLMYLPAILFSYAHVCIPFTPWFVLPRVVCKQNICVLSIWLQAL